MALFIFGSCNIENEGKICIVDEKDLCKIYFTGNSILFYIIKNLVVFWHISFPNCWKFIKTQSNFKNVPVSSHASYCA